MPMRIVCAAPQAPRVVGLQMVAIGGNATIMKGVPPRDSRVFVRLLVDDETLLIVNATADRRRATYDRAASRRGDHV